MDVPCLQILCRNTCRHIISGEIQLKPSPHETVGGFCPKAISNLNKGVCSQPTCDLAQDPIGSTRFGSLGFIYKRAESSYRRERDRMCNTLRGEAGEDL